MSDDDFVDTVINVLTWIIIGFGGIYFGLHVLFFVLKMMYGGGS